MSKYNDIRLKLQQDSQRVIDAYKTPSPEELTNIHNYALVVEHIEYIKYRASGINNKLKYKYVSGILRKEYDIDIDDDPHIRKLLAKHGIFTKDQYDFIVFRTVLLYYLMFIAAGYAYTVYTTSEEDPANSILVAVLISIVFTPLFDFMHRSNLYFLDKRFKKRIRD